MMTLGGEIGVSLFYEYYIERLREKFVLSILNERFSKPTRLSGIISCQRNKFIDFDVSCHRRLACIESKKIFLGCVIGRHSITICPHFWPCQNHYFGFYSYK
jgi:hypothetical protein